MNITLRLGGRTIDFTSRYTYRYLVWSTVTLLLIYPFVEKYTLLEGILNVFLLFTLVSGATAAATSRQQFYACIVFAILFVVGRWIIFYYPERWLVFANSVMGLMFFGYVAWIISKDLFTRSRDVSTDTIYGAVGVYLLIGVAWTFVYLTMELAVPGSYSIDLKLETYSDLNFHEFLYYSFVTMTTLGYGDVVPLLPPARALAYMEAVVGQVFLTVLVARLVGMYITQSRK